MNIVSKISNLFLHSQHEKKVKLTCAVKSGCNRIQKRILLNHKSFSIRHIPKCRNDTKKN